MRVTLWVINPLSAPSPLILSKLDVVLAERTGLEPATPGVTGRYSNQLNYRSFCCNSWWVL